MEITSSKKLYIVYDNVPNNITNEKFINKLKDKIKIDQFIISNEKKDNNFNRIYILIENRNKIRVIKNRFDISFNNNLYICQFLKNQNKDDIKRTLLLKENVINNFDKTKKDLSIIEPASSIILNLNSINFENEMERDIGEFQNIDQFINHLVILAQNLKLKELEAIIYEKYPQIGIKKPFLIGYLRNINEHHQKKNQKIEIKYNLDDFNLKLISNLFDYELWRENPCISLAFYGKSGTAKTSFSLALFESMGLNPLFVNHEEKLSKFHVLNKNALQFDDMKFMIRTYEDALAYVDYYNERDFNHKYGHVTVPQYTPRIFTTNNDFIFTPKIDIEDQIANRLLKMEIKENLFLPKKIYSIPSNIKKLTKNDFLKLNK